MGSRLVGALLTAILVMAVFQMVQTIRMQDRVEAAMPDETQRHGFIGTKIEYRGVLIEFRIYEERGQTDAGVAQAFMNKLRAYQHQIDLDIAKNGPIVEGK